MDDKNGAPLGKAGYSIPAGDNFWGLKQWGNPSSLMPATFPHGNSWQISNANSRLAFYPTSGGNSNVYELAAANVPCGAGPVTEANELDMFLQPKAMATPLIFLSEMGQLQLKIGTVALYSEVQNTCSYNASGYIAAVVLNTNPNPNSNPPIPHQTIFIQIRIGGTLDSVPALGWCPDYENGYPGQFCVDDSVKNYGGNYIYRYGTAINNLDILPRIIAVIKAGHTKKASANFEALVTDPSKWFISGMYFGINNYGGTNVTTQWFNPELKSSGGAFCSSGTKTQYICETPVNPTGWQSVGGGCYHRPTTISCP